MRFDLQEIRAAAAASRIKWNYHALMRAAERGIDRTLVHAVLEQGEIVEQYPRALPFPKCLLMARISPHPPLYVSAGWDQKDQRLYIITVHWLDPRRWTDPWTRRTQTS